jgi:hypothetical protein
MEMEIVMELAGNLGKLITTAGSNKLDAELMEMLDRYHFILEALAAGGRVRPHHQCLHVHLPRRGTFSNPFSKPRPVVPAVTQLHPTRST